MTGSIEAESTKRGRLGSDARRDASEPDPYGKRRRAQRSRRLLLSIACLFCLLLGSRAGFAEPPSPTAEPIRYELLPGELAVTLHQSLAHIGPRAVPCVTFVSDGLRAHGQAEIHVTILEAPGQPADLPALARSANGLFVAVLGEAKRGNLVGPGGYSLLGAGSGLFGRSDFTGVVYAPVLPEFAFTDNALQAIVVTGAEAAAAQRYGGTRVLALLTKQARYFPWPSWVDVGRPALSVPTHSLIDKVRTLALPDGHVSLAMPLMSPSAEAPSKGTFRVSDGRKTLTLELGEMSRKSLIALGPVGDDLAVALLSAPRGAAHGLVAWTGAEPTYLQAGTTPADRYDEPFLVLAVTGTTDYLNSFEKEDGVGLKLSVEHGRRLAHDIATGTDDRIELSDGNVLIVDLISGASP